MSELGDFRKDYILDRWVLIAKGRAKRPHQYKEDKKTQPKEECFFCPGNEEMTPPTIVKMPERGPWQIRWFENKFPALKPQGMPDINKERFFTYGDAYGYHWVLVESPKHPTQLAELNEEEIEQVLRSYVKVIQDMESKPGVEYVIAFKNSGPRAGTSIVHTHSQIMALPFIPTYVKEKVHATRRFIGCPYCQVVKAESNSIRKCYENEDWVVICPYASRFNYEAVIYPKQHITRLEHGNIPKLAEAMKHILQKIHEIGASYNYYIHYSPKGDDLHFQIEICPQIATWGGFERGTHVIINTVPPEDAAEYYRE